MKKLTIFLVLLTLVACISAYAQKSKKYYITAPWISDKQNPVVSYGNSRADAIANSGVTVWTEDEWSQTKIPKTEFHQSYNVKFADDSGSVIGYLSWSDGTMRFGGNADQSAKLFFNYLKPYIDGYIKEKKAAAQ